MAFDWNQFQPFEGGGIVAPDSGRTIDQPMLEKAPQLPDYDPGSLGYTYLTDPSAGGPMRSIGDPPFSHKSGGGIKFDPGPNTPSNPFYNNTGFAGGAPGGSVSMQQFNDAWLSSPYPGTVDGLKQFMAAHPEYAAAGITLGGSKGDKVYGPGGAYWGDAVISAGLGGRGKSGLSGDTGGGSAPGYGSLNGLGAGYMTSPIGEFTPPTMEDALNSPGLQFALEEANRMGQNSAAAKGTLLNGRFQQALQASNIQNALQGFGDVYNRAANTFGINYGVKTGNQDRPFQKYLSLADLGQRAASAS